MLQYGGGEFPALALEAEGKASKVHCVYLLNVAYVERGKLQDRLVGTPMVKDYT